MSRVGEPIADYAARIPKNIWTVRERYGRAKYGDVG